MALLPTDFWADYSLETVDTVQGVFIPLSNLPGLTAAEANATTGNGGEVLRQIVASAYTAYAAMDPKPTKTAIENFDTNDTGTRKVQHFDCNFVVTVPLTSFEIEAEA